MFPSTVRVANQLLQREQDVVTIVYVGHDQIPRELGVTSSHSLMTLQHGSRISVSAKDLDVGDELYTLAGFATITDISRSPQPKAVIEIDLDDPRGTMFVANQQTTSTRSLFIEVFGKKGQVQILSFRRFDRLRESLLECDALQTCRTELLKQRVCADLAEHDLGPGKLFVEPELAWPAVVALQKRARQLGKSMMQSEVVVSGHFEDIVLKAVNQGATRTNYVMRQVELECIPANRMLVRNTFIDEATVYVRSQVTNSTGDAHLRACGNPRTRVAKTRAASNNAKM